MKSPSELNVKIVQKIEEIPFQQWQEIFPSTPENYHFFKTLDVSHIPNFSFFYISVYKNDRLVGEAPSFCITYPLDTTVQGPLKQLSQAIKKIFPDLLNIKAVVCGCPPGEGHLALDGADKSAVLQAIRQGLEEMAREQKTSVVAFKDFSQNDTCILDNLSRNGYHKISSYPSSGINIRFKTFEEYLQSLSKSSRKSLRRKFRKVTKAVKIDLEIVNEVAGSLDAVYGLYLQTLKKSDFYFEEYTKDFFKNISQNMSHETKYFLWRIDGRLVAFDLCLVSKDTMIDELVGLDYSVAYKYNLYFITFRDTITWCIENGIKKYTCGATAYGTKRRLGCAFTPLYMYVKHINPLINPFFKILCSMLKPELFDNEIKELRRRGKL